MPDFQTLFQQVKKCSTSLALLKEETTAKILSDLISNIEFETQTILEANQKDLDKMDKSDPRYDRLLLSEKRLQAIISEILQVQELPSPLHKVLEERTLENGLYLTKQTVPLGVLGIIYEARPNVTFDVFCLALKSGNGLVLKGGSDAHHSNLAIMELIHKALEKNGVDKGSFQLLPPDRNATKALLEAVGWVDIIIPRGSQGLIDFVRENAKVPVIETGAGIVHTYVDATADLEKAKNIIFNAKTRRPSVCNSLDCLIIHRDKLNDLPAIIEKLIEAQVEIFADEKSFEILQGLENVQPATEAHFGTEFLSLKMAIKTVKGLDEALEHISRFSSKHSEAIIAEDPEILESFLNRVDAAAVYANASTAFTDGNQFGLGAEIGISTQKLHARGPMALSELCSYKWIIKGKGQIRN
ncbi:Gamma-glutamyl phosphate reductase [Indibacter alkaliphilus LW1]|uniref:Gamma-glutamyl phosphate reductase n=1 Tax=Indibacter alkaliphilus (strain CCUG 57479 / KCTC 22604 / LW1) TaxID=1189612 RepID=S2D9G6_INDAL|nr:glutamate-5-semialdehyde dehydrogenase [Indibacter alkaliphilus]EOZ95514.1 Gamma-glutamyl phosphate reductase [Indibacter alkaliphilus LW1]